MAPNFNLVLCLAGKGSRFTSKGYIIPKYLLKLKNKKSILENILLELCLGKNDQLKLILNKENEKWSNEIEEILTNYGYNFELIHVDDTKGQAHTAYIGAELTGNDKPIFFFNGDTIIKGRNLKKISEEIIEKKYAGAIDTFFAKDDHFSYVKVIDDIVVDVKEKIVISNLATTGLYGFLNSFYYQNFYKKLNTYNNEEYISDVYKKMLEEKEVIKNYFSKKPSNTIILGTPEEYEAWLKNEN